MNDAICYTLAFILPPAAICAKWGLNAVVRKEFRVACGKIILFADIILNQAKSIKIAWTLLAFIPGQYYAFKFIYAHRDLQGRKEFRRVSKTLASSDCHEIDGYQHIEVNINGTTDPPIAQAEIHKDSRNDTFVIDVESIDSEDEETIQQEKKQKTKYGDEASSYETGISAEGIILPKKTCHTVHFKDFPREE